MLYWIHPPIPAVSSIRLLSFLVLIFLLSPNGLLTILVSSVGMSSSSSHDPVHRRRGHGRVEFQLEIREAKDKQSAAANIELPCLGI